MTDHTRDLDEWRNQYIAETYTASKIAEMAEGFKKEFPRMSHPAVEALFNKERAS